MRNSCLQNLSEDTAATLFAIDHSVPALSIQMTGGNDSLNWLKEINVAKYIFVGYSSAKAIL